MQGAQPEHSADLRLQQRLAAFNAERLAPATPREAEGDALQEEIALRQAEARFLRRLRSDVAALLPAAGAREWQGAAAFLAWFERLRLTGPGQGHALFDWLASAASYEQMCWFLQQETAGEAGFEDLLAYTQVRMPERPKLEMARNYWDEMGRGKPRAMHGPLLQRMARELGLKPAIGNTVAEALANAMVGFAVNRGYAWHAVGALGAIELTAPGRAAKVAQGMRRLGMSHPVRAYFELHAAIDVHHSQAWSAEVIAPLVQADLHRARWIAEGALIRLLGGQRCFERYRRELQAGLRPCHAAESPGLPQARFH